jgi:hypothetical protein
MSETRKISHDEVTLAGDLTTPPQEQNEKLRVRLQDAIGESYKLLELLGRGGMGIVFRAGEVALDREVALKVLALDPQLAPDAYGRFEREAKLAARLDHPHIVPIFAVGQRNNVAYYTMRLVRGGSVEEMLAGGKQLSLEHAIKLLRDVAAALDHAHRQGVVHRDIKPANILLGETGHALVADFGIAKALGPRDVGSTGTGIIGSPGYMSPEQWKGSDVDGRADQYSLAIVAYEMLTGRRPFESPQLQEVLRMHLSAEVPPLSHYRTGLPEGADDALRRALAKDPAHRFSSVTAFVDALEGLRSATIGTQTQRQRRYEVQAKPKKGAGGVFFTLLLIGGVGAAFAFPQTRDPMMGALAPVFQAAGIAHEPAPPASPVPNALSIDSVLSDTASLTSEHAIISDSELGGRTPIALDSTLGLGGTPRRMQYGWIRIVINGGTAPAFIDGERLGSTPVIRRAEAGDHLVTVLGAGDAFLPSQIDVRVTPGDTAVALFATPEALRRSREAKAEQDSAAAAAVDTVTAPPDSSQR